MVYIISIAGLKIDRTIKTAKVPAPDAVREVLLNVP